MSNIEDTVRRVLDLAAAYRLAEHPQASLTELEAAIRTALSAGDGEAVAWQYRLRPTWSQTPWDCFEWKNCTVEAAADYQKTPLLHDWEYQVRALGVIGGAGGVPAGWKLVPVEPTEEMLVHGQEAWLAMWRSKPSIEDCKEAENTYKAMLSASPLAPQAATQGEAVAWLPIETAPQQDDYSFLVRRSPRGKNWTYTMQVSRFEGNMYPDHLDSNVDFDDRVTDATHWAPMLPAPAPSKEQTNG